MGTIDTKAAIAKASMAGSSGDPQTCRDCQKTGVPILPVTYGVAPKKAVEGVPSALTTFSAYMANKVLDESGYFLRSLPSGYLYVLKSDMSWDGYVVDAAGLLRMMPVGRLPASAADQPPMSETCQRQADNIPAQVIAVDPKCHPHVWIAFSRFRWTEAVLTDYMFNIDGCRDQRMHKVDVAAIAAGNPPTNAVMAHAHNIAHWVVDYRPNGTAAYLNRFLVDPAQQREGQGQALADKMAQIGECAQTIGCLLALSDVPGIMGQLNFQRHAAFTERQLWQSDPDVAWKHLSSQSIARLRERIYVRTKASLIQDRTGKPWSEENNPSHVEDNKLLHYRSEFERGQAAGGLKGVKFVPRIKGDSVGRYHVPVDQKAGRMVKGKYERIEKHYDEAARKAFDAEYAATLKKYTEAIAAQDKDFSVWLNANSQPAYPNAVAIARLDFRETDTESAADYIRLVSETVGGGPQTDHSLAWYSQTLPLPPTDPAQILTRALVGNQAPLIEWLDENKKDKVYDAIAGIVGADDLKVSKWASPVVAAYANPVLAAVGTTAIAMNKDGGMSKALRDRLTHVVAATLKLWDKIEIAFVRLPRTKLGDLQQGLLAAGFSRTQAVSGAANVGTQKGQARASARMRLPSAVAKKTVDAVLWTVDTIDDLLAGLQRAPTNIDKTARATIEGLNNLPKKGVRGITRTIPAGQARDLVTRIVKRTDSVMGNPTGLLSAGVIFIQWFQAVENLEQAQRVGGAEQVDAVLGLGDALASIISAGAMLVEPLEKARAIATKKAVNQSLVKIATQVGYAFGGAASLFNAIQSAGASRRSAGHGDLDAGYLHGAAAVSFGVSAGIGLAIAFGGAKTAFLGSMLGLGPAGWVVLLTVVGVGLTYAAILAEDSDGEIFVARNAHWSISNRTDSRYASWQQEAEGFTALWYGVKAELEWGDSWTFGKDTVRIIATIAEPTTDDGWRYRLWLRRANGQELMIYRENSRVEPLSLPYRMSEPAYRAAREGAMLLDGRDFKWHDRNVVHDAAGTRIEHPIDVDDDVFTVARLEFEYFPDASDLAEKTRLEIREAD